MNAPASQESAEDVITDKATSVWLRTALTSALKRDSADALNDALALAGILEERLRSVLDIDESV
jgi:hypothetical protein